jgi:gas vesicle protein GvpK/gas vesicle protein GvpA/GvpJ/GvpM family
VTGKASDITLLDVADRLLDTGVSITGEATISVADVDLIYLGLDLALGSVERIRGKGAPPFVPPLQRESDALAPRTREGPGAMSADRYAGIPASLPERINVDPSDVERSLAKLVLTIVEFIRQLLERQAIRRMEGQSLTEAEVDRVGTALMRLDEKVVEMAARFGLRQEELRLGLGPLGELL